jgi:Pyruvate/2-oxoacid:ferredoxin oxidoreductase gamma subunit
MGKQPDLDLPTIRRELGRLGAGSVLEVDALALALGAGGPNTFNVVMLGALLSVESFPLTYDAMVSGLEVAAKGRYMQQNLLSLERGREYGVQQRPNGSDAARVSV